MNFNFDARSVNPDQRPEPLPLDWYPVIITDSEVKETKDQTGMYLSLTLRIIPPHPKANREQQYNLNLKNNNQQTVDIAYRQLSAICHVVGVLQLQDTRQLHNIPFQAKIGPQTNDPSYGEVKAVRDFQGNDPGKQGAPAPYAQPAPVAQPAQSVWGNTAPQQPPPAYGAPPANPTQAPPPAWGAPALGPAAPIQPAAFAPASSPAPPAAFPGAPPPATAFPSNPAAPAPAASWQPQQPVGNKPPWA